LRSASFDEIEVSPASVFSNDDLTSLEANGFANRGEILNLRRIKACADH
jgi:hypothetical protein